MACSESGGSNIILWLGLFLVASSFCHCATLTRLKALDKLRENSTLSQGQVEGSGLCHGRLFIGLNPLQGAKLKGTKTTKNPLDVDTDYQADMGWPEPKQPKGQGESFLSSSPDDAAVERLLKMDPKVECTGDSMKLQVQDAASTPGSLLFVDRGSHLSPLPLSKLPSSCGYTIRSTRRDLVLVAPYDGCFVALEEDRYILPLRWCGVPVRMSCPLIRPSSPNAPMVTCHTEGMVVKTEWAVSVAKIKVNLNGNWEPLLKASPRCGFSVVVHPEGVVISVHYAPCLEKKDGMYTLELAGDGDIKISCPPPSAAQPEGPKQQTETPSKGLHPPTPSHNLGSTHGPTQSPQSAVPQVPGFPQNREEPSKKPNQGPKDINQPQFPYHPFYHHFFYPYPGTESTTTIQPLSSSVPKKNEGLQPQQTVHPSNLPVAPEVPQPFVPLPFYPWTGQPEKVPPVQPPATQPPNGKAESLFYHYPYYVKPPIPDVPPVHRPELKPITTTSPQVIQTKGQIKQPYYPFQFYPQPPKPETPPTQPPVTKPPPSKLDEGILPNPSTPPFGLPWKPVGPHEGQEHKPFNPFIFYPQPPASQEPKVQQPLHPQDLKTPEKPLTEKTVSPKPPVSQEPQGQIYHPLYQYPFYLPILPSGPYQTHMPPPQQSTTLAPKGQVQQPLGPLPPEASKPKGPEDVSPSKPAPESRVPSQPQAPQGQVYQYPYPLYPQPGLPEKQPAEKPTTVQQPSQPEAPRGQVHQYPYPFYPQPGPPENQATEKPTTVQQPSQPEAPRGQVHKFPLPLYPQPGLPEKQPAEKPTTVQQPSQPEAPWGQVHQYPYPLYPQPGLPEKQPTEKPTTVQQPSQPEAPWGQVHQYPYPLYPQPGLPEKQPTEKLTTVQQPSQPEAPWGQVHQYPYLLYPQPGLPEKQPTEKPTTVKQPSQPEAPWGQVHQYPYPFYPRPGPPENQATEKPTTVQPSQPEAPRGQVHKFPLPLYPQPGLPEKQPAEKPTTVQQPSQPEAPWGQVHQYPYPLYPQPGLPEKQPTEKPTTVQQPSQPEAPWGQVHKYPYPLYPQPGLPEKQPTEKPTVQKPSRPEAPWGQMPQLFPYPFYPQPEPEKPAHKPSYPQPSKIPGAGTNGATTPTEKPVPSEQPSGVKPSDGQVYDTFTFHHPQQPQPQQVTIAPPSNGGIIPQPGSPQISPLYCPQFCPSGFSNCCPQIAFHQHLHIVPPGLGSKDAPPVNPALPSLSSLAYFGFGNGLGTAPHPQKPTEAMATEVSIISTSAPTSLQSLSPENEKQPYILPPDGNPAAQTSIPRKPTNPELPIYPHFAPNLLYSNWPYVPQNEKLPNLQQSQSEAHYNAPSNPQHPGNDPMNPVVQYVPYHVQLPEQRMSKISPGDMNNHDGTNFMSYVGQYKQQEDLANKENKPTAKELQPTDKKSSDSKGPTHPEVQSELFDRFMVPYYMLQDAEAPAYNSSQPQPFVSGSKKSTKHQQTVHPYSEAKSYVLLQHGPPGSKPNSVPHFVPLPQDPAFSAAHLKPKFSESLKDLWKPNTPLGSHPRIPAHFPGTAFQHWHFAADNQANGLNQPIQTGGNRKQK